MSAEITTEEMYKIIKKQNGEKFAKILRQNVLLDTPNLKHILEFAGVDAEDAKNLIPVLREINIKSKEKPETNQEQEFRDPLELLNKAGYDAFYVNNLSQQNSIAKYFKQDEQLCTFRDSKRYKDYYIIHAVKKNIRDIKRPKNPQRQDEYGTSVISIQIAKSGGFISIKNRYNHTVDNPDATFNNNPDNIIRGLTASLKHKFGVDFMTQDVNIPDNYRLVKNQLVRFNYEVDNVYYGEKYYFEGSEITKSNPDYEVMLDTVILNTKTGQVKNIRENTEESNIDLAYVLNNEISGHKIKIEKNKTTNETIINIIDENKNIKELARTKYGCITSLHLYKTSEIGTDFIRNNNTLKEFYAPKLKKMGRRCFECCKNLETLFIPELEEMDERCFNWNTMLKEFYAPKLKKMSACCFYNNRKIKKIYIPELEDMELGCFSQTDELIELIGPKLKKIGNGCFSYNAKLKKIYFPELEEMGLSVFANVKRLHEIIIPKLKEMNHNFTYSAMLVKTLYAPELESMGLNCFDETKIIKNLYAPKLRITKYTPKCILRNIKVTKFQDGIRNVLHLSQRSFNEDNIFKSQQVRK